MEIPDNQAGERIVKVGPKDNPKCYCRDCGEPVVYIPDMPQATGGMHGAQATLISNSDNRITTNYYYGSGTPEEQIDTPYGSCRKSEARLCKQCRKWVPLAYFNQEKGVCYDCELKESQESFEEGKSFFDMGFYDDAILFFKKYESLCPKEKLAEVKTYIGRCYYELKDYKQALKHFVAASKSSADSNYYIAICYINGTGIAKDESKALDLLKKSANMGNQKAIDFLLERQRLEERKRLEMLELHPIEENEKYGFADENGNVVIPCKWKYAYAFQEGMSKVKGDNDKYGFIDKTGNMAIPCKWEYTEEFHEGLAVVKDDNDKYGFIDKTGDVVIPCKWKKAWEFSEGLAIVRDDNYKKLGAIDKTGQMVVPCKWKDFWDFSGGLAKVKDDNDKLGFIDKTGEMVIPCRWKNVWAPHEGLLLVQDNNSKWGVIDKTGKMIRPCEWSTVNTFREGMAMVNGENGKYGFIDKTGEMVIPCKWKLATSFSEGLAYVKGDDEKWVYIDKTGKVISK